MMIIRGIDNKELIINSDSKIKIKFSLDNVKYVSKPKDSEIGKISKRIGSKIATLTEDNFNLITEDIGEHGQSMCSGTFANGSRSISNFEQTQLFVLDFDSGITLEQVYDRATKYELSPLFSYATLSSNESNDRFRVVFLNDVTIRDKKVAETMLNALTTIFPESDAHSNDIAHLYFGGKKLLRSDDSMPEITIEKLFRNMTLYLKHKHGATHYKEKLHKFSQKTGLALNENKMLDVRISDSREDNDSGKISPKTIIIPDNRIVYGEKLPSIFYELMWYN